jgi:hypothetical protein
MTLCNGQRTHYMGINEDRWKVNFLLWARCITELMTTIYLPFSHDVNV